MRTTSMIDDYAYSSPHPMSNRTLISYHIISPNLLWR